SNGDLSASVRSSNCVRCATARSTSAPNWAICAGSTKPLACRKPSRWNCSIWSWVSTAMSASRRQFCGPAGAQGVCEFGDGARRRGRMAVGQHLVAQHRAIPDDRALDIADAKGDVRDAGGGDEGLGHVAILPLTCYQGKDGLLVRLASGGGHALAFYP